jgi:mediator of RNA polymerase II transcription subunit 12, fungi type
MPPEFLVQLRTILPHIIPNAAVANLANAHRDSSGALVHGTPVLNRPWEWIENLGDQPFLDPKEEEREKEEKERLKSKYLVKNSASISLEAFGARVTGDGVLDDMYPGQDSRTKANIHSFEDGLSAESVFKRDWRETQMEIVNEALLSGGRGRGDDDDDVGPLPSYLNQGQNTRRSTPRKSSPATSAQSRGSATSIRQSPGLSTISRATGSASSDIVEIQSVTAASMSTSKKSSKRKASHVSDEDVDIVESTDAATSRAPKKVKTKTISKPRAKKR